MKLRLGTIFTVAALTLGVGLGMTASASTSTKSTPKQDVAKAKQALAPYLKAPTDLPNATTLPKAPAAGQTVVYLVCDNPNCTLNSTNIEKAATALGWNYKAIPFKLADTSTLISAMDSALQFDPAFVMFTGVPEAAWAGEIPKYKAAGVGLVPTVSGTYKPDATILGYANDKEYTAALIDALGNWFIQDSGGTGHAMVMRFNEVPQAALFADKYKKFVEKNCSQCTVDLVDINNQQLASQASASVTASAVQANPSITHVVAPVPSATNGLRQALSTIGRDNIKISGYLGQYQQFANIEAGTDSAWVSQSRGAQGYNYIDTGLHGMAGKKYQYKTDTYAPIMLVTKDNIASLGGANAAKATNDFPIPSNYADLYSALWKLKSASTSATTQTTQK